jgi:hypothetical protein
MTAGSAWLLECLKDDSWLSLPAECLKDDN